MNKKRIRQMTASLLRRLTTQPVLKYMAPHRAMLTELLEEKNYLQRFVPLYDGTRIQCAAVLELCLEQLDRHTVRLHWVKGHADTPQNNRCDQLAVSEWQKLK